MPRPGDPDPPRIGKFSSPDALLTPSYMAEAAQDPIFESNRLEGIPRLWNALRHHHQLPAAYYLAARFPDDFEPPFFTPSMAADKTCHALVSPARWSAPR